ncbi:hypothetical protein AHAS_Ahas15G0370600 [Arachis hypogaea]
MKILIEDPKLGWMIAFLFVASFLGLFSVVPLRKVMIIDFKLTYPSGAATAHLINSFHTPQGAKLAKKQVKLGKFFSFSFFWGFFQWFYTAAEQCGFQAFPSLGLKAYQNRFYFDFSVTYIGVGMICPYIINISVLLGGIFSWGIMWSIIENKEGDWYPKDLGGGSLHGIQGYRDSSLSLKQSYDDQCRTELFLKDQIPTWFAVGGYVAIAAISIATLPHIFHQLKWYYILVIYLTAPTLAFCNAYGSSHGGVLAGLASCGVMMNIVSTASDLTQDFKTGSSPLLRLAPYLLGKKGRFIPVPMTMAIPFYIGPYFAIEMCVGSLILFVWEKINKAKADTLGAAVASGLICGEGIWTQPDSVLALAGIKPPICMKFLSRATNERVDAFLGS